MSKVDGSYLVAKTLQEEGVQHLFYLMGGPNYEIVNNSEDNGIRCVDFRHEQAAAMAAHAYARVSRKPGVTTSASGPGTLNLLTGVYNAFGRLCADGDAWRGWAVAGYLPWRVPRDRSACDIRSCLKGGVSPY